MTPQSPFYPVQIILQYFTFTLDKVTLIPICGLSRECRHESSVMHITRRDLQFTMYFPKPVARWHSCQTQPWENEMDLKRCVSFKVLSRFRPGLWKFCCNNEQSKNSCSLFTWGELMDINEAMQGATWLLPKAAVIENQLNNGERISGNAVRYMAQVTWAECSRRQSSFGKPASV